MIETEQEYQEAKNRMQGLGEYLAAHPQPAPQHLHDPRWQGIFRDSTQSVIDEIRDDIAEYEARARPESIASLPFEELPTALIHARLAQNLTPKALAERAGVNEQEIERYEATRYASATLEQVAQVIRALGITVRQEVLLPKL